MKPAYMKTILVLLLMNWCIDAKLPKKPPDVTKTMMKLLNACFTDRLNPVITTPDLHDYFREASWHIGIPPMILIDKHFKADNAEQHYPRFATFVFAPYSVKSFKAMLLKARASPWWHKDSLFFVIGNLEGGCKPASKILKRAWKMNLLSSLFLCHEEGRSPMLYTYNPYGNRAPHPWKQIGGFNTSNDQWTLYAMKYHEGRKNCASLIFNKATYVDEKKTESADKRESRTKRIKNEGPRLDYVGKGNSPDAFENILQDLLSVVNITAILNGDYADYSDNQEETSFLSKLINKSYNMSLMIRNTVSKLIAIISFEFSFSGTLIHETKFSIFPLVLFGLIIGICQKLKIASITNDNSVDSSNDGSTHRFNRATGKFVFYGLVQLIFVISIVYYGNLSSFLKQSNHFYENTSKNVETTQCDHYDPTLYQKSLNGGTLGTQFINSSHGSDNFKYVGDPAVKCKRILQLMIKSAMKQQPMVSKSNIDGILSYWCRENGPLRKQIDRLQLRFKNADLEEYLYETDMNFPEKTLSNIQTGRMPPLYRPIQLQDLIVAFTVLVIGIGISFWVFMIETFLRFGPNMKRYICAVIDYVKSKFVRLIRLFYQ